MKKLLSVLLFGFFTICGSAQTAGYRFYSRIDSVPDSGFYDIKLTPELEAHLDLSFTDVRVVNSKGRWIPHLIWRYKETGDIQYLPLQIIKNETEAGITQLIIRGTDQFINSFNLRTRNSKITRTAKLSGSDDQVNWYAIADSLEISPYVVSDENIASSEVSFPSSDYTYYKLTIVNGSHDPLDIKSVQWPRILKPGNPPRSPNPPCRFEQAEQGKNSVIAVIQKENYHTDLLGVKVSGVKYFYRKMDVCLAYVTSDGEKYLGSPIATYYLSNKSLPEFEIPSSNEREYYLVIHNEDNLPLKIDEVQTFGPSEILKTYLNKGEQYRLILDNPSATSPDFDLNKMNDVIADSARFIKTGPVLPFEQAEKPNTPGNRDKWMLWLILALALIVLGYFTFRMVKEVDKRKRT